MVLKGLIDPKISRILDTFMRNKNKPYHIHKLAKESKVPVSSTFRILKKLVSAGYIEKITIDKFNIYKLAENNKTKKLEVFFSR